MVAEASINSAMLAAAYHSVLRSLRPEVVSIIFSTLTLSCLGPNLRAIFDAVMEFNDNQETLRTSAQIHRLATITRYAAAEDAQILAAVGENLRAITLDNGEPMDDTPSGYPGGSHVTQDQRNASVDLNSLDIPDYANSTFTPM